jgi:hypothetical protein
MTGRLVNNETERIKREVAAAYLKHHPGGEYGLLVCNAAQFRENQTDISE